jgi:RNA polymerase sigma factor (sigma-70 family)
MSCRGGDEAAWEALVHRYQRLIYAIPRRAGLDEDLAADVFQDVFTTLFQKLNDIEEPEKIQAWLVTTARRKTSRLLAKGRQWKQTSGDEDDTELMNIPDKAEMPDAVLVQLEQQHRVRTAVKSLDERCRRLLEMLFYQSEALPYAEIAAALGTNEGSIGPTRARCLQKLLLLLKG